HATTRLIAATGVSIMWDEIPAGSAAFTASGDALPEAVIDSIRTTRVALKGKLSTPVGAGYESPNVRLRKALDLFAMVRPLQILPGHRGRYDDVDIVIIREATEDVYAGIEHQVVPGVVQSIKVTTKAACERVVRFAFEYAREHDRKKVTLIHKANIMKRSDGLFLRVGQAIAEEYADIAFDALIADNACMQMVRDPSRYDVLVAQNLFGDLLSDLGAGLVGGISNVWGTLRGSDDIVVFEAIHGIADELIGSGKANPLTLIRPASALLRHLGETDAADRVDAAVAATLEAGIRTADIGGDATTEGFVDAIIARL
ncbi:MAG: isocitrate dehydrogenase (NAD+), partial [Myxococcota bacterium]